VLLFYAVIASLSAVAGSSAASGQSYAGENNRAERCLFDMARGSMTLMTGAQEAPVAAGGSAQINPHWTPYPSAWDPVPSRCLTGWGVSHPRLARLSPDRRRLVVSPDAPVGTLIQVSARYRGHPIKQSYRVTQPVMSPLVGTWRQRADGCAPDTSVMELVFRSTGEFSLTFAALMHGAVDYRGRWQVEGNRLLVTDVRPANGELPGDVGTETLFQISPGNELTFATPWHGTKSLRGTCRRAFIR
jgi:hypothetical protein